MVTTSARALLPPQILSRLGSKTPPLRLSFWTGSAHVENPGGAWRLRKRLKFFLRAWLQPRLTDIWFSRLIQPDIAPLWTEHPRLALKLQRPYVSCEWDARTRLASLLGHYSQLPGLFTPDALGAIYGSGLDLLHLINPGNGRQLTLQLCYRDKFEKEGELTLALVESASGLMLATLTFCLVYNLGKRTVIVGGMQGHADPRTRGLIHDVAKEMHGLRPKALVLWALQQLAGHWRSEDLQAVCDAQHVSRHWRTRTDISARYDEFWLESDGLRLPGGGWSLPLQPRARAREELKASRRKQHERRYGMLASLRPLLLATVDELAPNSPTPRSGMPQPRRFSYVTNESAPAPRAPDTNLPPRDHSY